MDRIIIEGGRPLNGTVYISGAKNAALPLMAASLLTEETVILANVPHLADIVTMSQLISELGVKISIDGNNVSRKNYSKVLLLNARKIANLTAKYDIVRKMRASVLVLGPLLTRFGEASISLPGGCAIGTRPIDFHIKGLEQMGAVTELKDGYINTYAPNGLHGAEIFFDCISVGATENILMAATLAKGTTIIHNAACEPEVEDLANFLVKMGAKIKGIGTNRLEIEGVEVLSGCYHSIIPDRIEAATFAIAAGMTGGELDIQNCPINLFEAVTEKLELAGINISAHKNGFIAKSTGHIKPVDISTHPYPGFPTDMQAQFMALMTIAHGESKIIENIYENRFMHVAELNRMGANIQLKSNLAIVNGVESLKAAEIMATDLRASVSLVLAGLSAQGQTLINRVYHIDRGYENIEEKLSACGAKIERI